MKAYSLMSFLNKTIYKIVEKEEDFAFEYKKAIVSDSSIEGNIISKIKIPLIQREYAQGRDSNLSLRYEFLKNIFEHLYENKELKLDFIYGSLDRGDKEITFLPLDGQQRLTTLFLLHWYIIKREVPPETESYEILKIFLSKFTYETRDTSRRFFLNLVDFNFEGNPKDEIEKAYWFSNYFKLDPTVVSVLNTLETIHDIYDQSEFKGNLLERLDNIVFYVLPMDQFKLTDDLYIKLNARGKVLSPFENLKADLIGFLKKYRKYNKEMFFSEETFFHYDIISNKFDNKWADFFWQKAKDDKEKTIDHYFFRFIHKVLINEYIVAFNQRDILKVNIFTSLIKSEKDLSYSTFDFYKQRVFFDQINNIEKLLDFYVENHVEIFDNIQPVWKQDFEWNIFKSDYTMVDRMLFDAVNFYALNNQEFNLEKFKDWIRVVWNIIIDPDIRSIGLNKSAMAFIREISCYSSDILKNLKNGKLDYIIETNNSIYNIQLKEEKEKAIKILDDSFTKDQKWFNAIILAEKHPLFLGHINFLLKECLTHELFKKRFLIAEKLFNENGATELIGRNEHSLFRYIISKFTNFEEIKSINYRDSYDYWQLLLRRENYEKVQSIILSLCNFDSLEGVKNEIFEKIKIPSIVLDVEHIHNNLYLNKHFTEWYLDNKIDVLWYYSNHLYLNKYNDKSGNRVQIDSFRNELIDKLVSELNLKTNSKCGLSAFYKGKNIECHLDINDEIRLTIEFTEFDEIYVGIWSEYNLIFKDPQREDCYWIEFEKLEDIVLNNLEDVQNAFERIELLIKKNKFLCPTNTPKIN